MKNLFFKEIKLCASPLSYFFILFAFMAFLPGYPILLGAFFTTLGIFYSFQSIRDNNDMSYSLLLPVSKKDIVSGKYAFILFIEICSFIIMAAVTLLRMTFLFEAKVYTSNALMCANFVFLGFALLIFGVFNFIFVSGFFKTAYYFTKPFIIYCVTSFPIVAVAEALHYIPGLSALNTPTFENMKLQISVFLAGVALFALLTFLSLKKSQKEFENADM